MNGFPAIMTKPPKKKFANYKKGCYQNWKMHFIKTWNLVPAAFVDIMGVGTNRMNKYTVGMATQGYANYLNKCFPEVKVAIAHDVRNNSRQFAEIAANIFAANGIKVFLFESIRPTPELSFAIRNLGCQGG